MSGGCSMSVLAEEYINRAKECFFLMRRARDPWMRGALQQAGQDLLELADECGPTCGYTGCCGGARVGVPQLGRTTSATCGPGRERTGRFTIVNVLASRRDEPAGLNSGDADPVQSRAVLCPRSLGMRPGFYLREARPSCRARLAGSIFSVLIPNEYWQGTHVVRNC